MADHQRCCHLHRDIGCCDPEDCGPCCENCPTCPTLARGRERAAHPAVAGFPVVVAGFDPGSDAAMLGAAAAYFRRTPVVLVVERTGLAWSSEQMAAGLERVASGMLPALPLANPRPGWADAHKTAAIRRAEAEAGQQDGR